MKLTCKPLDSEKWPLILEVEGIRFECEYLDVLISGVWHNFASLSCASSEFFVEYNGVNDFYISWELTK